MGLPNRGRNSFKTPTVLGCLVWGENQRYYIPLTFSGSQKWGESTTYIGPLLAIVACGSSAADILAAPNLSHTNVAEKKVVLEWVLHIFVPMHHLICKVEVRKPSYSPLRALWVFAHMHVNKLCVCMSQH